MKALALIEAPDHVCGRYRISAFAPALDAAGWSLSVEGLASGPIARVKQLRGANRFDAVILQRKLLPGWQVAILRAASRWLVFDFDDAVLHRDSYDARGPHCRRRANRFGKIVRAADRVIAGNDFLAECAAIHGTPGDRLKVIPSCIAMELYRPKDHAGSRDPIVRLVWIGSSSTLQGIEQQRPLLERLGKTIPNLRLRLISDRFPHFDPLPVESVPWTSAGEATAIAGGDIGISWVPDDVWSRGKCGLKVLQYGAAGLPTVANPVGVHPKMIAQGRSGFLPTTEDDWVGAIRTMVSDPELRRKMGREARKTVEDHYSVSAWSGPFVAAVAGLGAMPPPNLPFGAVASPGEGGPAMTRHATRHTRMAPPREALFKAPHWDWTKAGDFGWWVRPEWRSALIGPDGLRIEELRAQGRLVTIKTGPQRVVYRADLPGGTVFVKHYLIPSWREMVRQWLRRGKGRNEGRRALKLAAIGVPTITPIALGEQRKGAFLFENYLITPEIPDTLPLDEFVEDRLAEFSEARRSRIRQALAIALGELMAHLHDAGFVHQDFHPGNLLVRLDADDLPRLAMIDLDALRVRRDVDWDDARANLALLNNYFWTRCARSDRLRFLTTYLKLRGAGEPPDLRAFADGIDRATRTWAERLWRRWGRRCWGHNKYFKAFRGPRTWAVASRDLDRPQVRALLDDPDAPFARPDAVMLKVSRTTTVAEVTMPVLGRPTPVIYKRFNRKKILDPVLNLFRPSRAWRAWQNGQHLACREVPTPQNLMVLGRTSGRRVRCLPHQFWSHETYLATVKAEPSITLGDYANKVLASLPPGDRRDRIRRLTTALAGLIRVMHERSLSHRDLKAANILIVGDPDAPSPGLSLIDLVGVSLEHPMPRRRLVQNLARLQISLAHVPGRTRTDGLRFLRAYLPWVHTSRPAWKSLWREVEIACGAKESQNRRRGRILS